MPRPQPTPHSQLATDLLHEARQLQDSPTGPIDPELAASMRQEATVRALLAVAEELAAVREHVQSITEALKSPDGWDAGTSLYYIADWLKVLSEKQR